MNGMTPEEIKICQKKRDYLNENLWEKGSVSCNSCTYLKVDMFIPDPVGADCHCIHPQNINKDAPYYINKHGDCKWFSD